MERCGNYYCDYCVDGYCTCDGDDFDVSCCLEYEEEEEAEEHEWDEWDEADRYHDNMMSERILEELGLS